MKQKRVRLDEAGKREVIFQLILRGGRVKETLPHVDIERTTLWRIKKSSMESGLYSEVEAEVAPLLEKRRKGLAYRFLDAIEASIDAYADKIPNASLKDTAVAIGIMTDKLLLLSGEPTERTETNVTQRNFNLSAELEATVARAFEPRPDDVDSGGNGHPGDVDIVI